MVENDTDFWDWYTRRLVTNRKFVRDVVARKSFSKLRSAIAGLYTNRGLKKQAEAAFGEARMLYPLSPEANFRLAEVHMRAGEFDKAKDLITEFGEMDPANAKVKDFLKQIDRIQDLNKQISVFENENKGGKLTADKALKLAELYRSAGQMGKFNSLLNGMLNSKDLPPVVYFQVAQTYERAKRFADMSKALDLCLDRLPENSPARAFLDIAKLYSKAKNTAGMRKAMQAYLKKSPSDWKAWLDLAQLHLQFGDKAQATTALGAAVRYGGAQAQQLIQQNPNLRQVHQTRASRTKDLMGLGL